MIEPVIYDVFKEMFYLFGINPYEFKELSGEHVRGFYPKMSGRVAKVDVKKLAEVLWNHDV